jgi:hypothetical protein
MLLSQFRMQTDMPSRPQELVFHPAVRTKKSKIKIFKEPQPHNESKMNGENVFSLPFPLLLYQ